MISVKEANEFLHAGYLGVDAPQLASMGDLELAQWQARFPADSAQFVLADREWQRRMLSHQLQEQFKLDERLAKNNRWWALWTAVVAATMGILGTLGGAWMSSPSKSAPERNSAVVAASPSNLPSQATVPVSPPTAAKSASGPR